jgi:hypothetical protein
LQSLDKIKSINQSQEHNFVLVFFISSSWVNLRMHTENQLYTLPGSAWWWVGGVESEFSDPLWLWLS